MFDYVKDVGLQFSSSLTKRSKTDLIILHHVEGNMSVQAIHQMHKANGHKGIDYNIYVGLDGTVQWGRGLEYEGGHVSNSYPTTKGMNARSVGIVCNGNFNTQKMPLAQLDALKRVVADVVRQYKFESVSQIVSHKEAAGAGYTDCPGTYFPIQEIREYIRNGGREKEAAPELPQIAGYMAKVVDGAAGIVDFVATGVNAAAGVARVEFRIYPVALGGSAVKVLQAKQNATDPARWAKRVNVLGLFGGQRGKYVMRVRAYDKAGNASAQNDFVYFTLE